MRKVSIRTVENTIGLARSVANGTTKFPFMGYCADLMEKMLEEIKFDKVNALAEPSILDESNIKDI